MLVSSELRAEQCCDSYITQEGGGRLPIKKTFLRDESSAHTAHTSSLLNTYLKCIFFISLLRLGLVSLFWLTHCTIGPLVLANRLARSLELVIYFFFRDVPFFNNKYMEYFFFLVCSFRLVIWKPSSIVS